MIIDINQKKIALGEKYKIFVDGEYKYSASTAIISFLPIIFLKKNNTAVNLLTIDKEWSWFKTKYKIRFRDNQNVKFISVSIWKSHYQCKDGSDLYDIYGHKGRKFSIYRNGEQIAWWDKEMVSWFEGDNYRIVVDDDSNHDLIIGFCLIIDNLNSDNDGGATINFDFGNFGPQAKEFNNDWKPKVIL